MRSAARTWCCHSRQWPVEPGRQHCTPYFLLPVSFPSVRGPLLESQVVEAPFTSCGGRILAAFLVTGHYRTMIFGLSMSCQFRDSNLNIYRKSLAIERYVKGRRPNGAHMIDAMCELRSDNGNMEEGCATSGNVLISVLSQALHVV